ncbi:MAG: hypothetical protein U5J99_06890 [Parvularculaceae bacterium]|nr:hypothetical protein [Parvularculaceae bacterium]
MLDGVLKSRAVLSLFGEDATAFLQGIVTQDVTQDAAAFTALLTPQGKILFDFFLVPVEGGYLLDCDASAAPALLKRLTMYKLRAKIALAEAAALSVHLGAAEGVTYADPRLDRLPSRTIAATHEAAAVDDAYDAVRLAAGVPEFGRDFAAEEVFLLDVNYDVLRAVSYKKGCFVGQEVTSRMKRKGEIRKRTLMAHGAGLAAGAPVLADENSIGEVLSVRGEQGLVLVRLDRLAEARAEGTPLTAGAAPLRIDIPAYLEPA